jgi:hypothetical protein
MRQCTRLLGLEIFLHVETRGVETLLFVELDSDVIMAENMEAKLRHAHTSKFRFE